MDAAAPTETPQPAAVVDARTVAPETAAQELAQAVDKLQMGIDADRLEGAMPSAHIRLSFGLEMDIVPACCKVADIGAGGSTEYMDAAEDARATQAPRKDADKQLAARTGSDLVAIERCVDMAIRRSYGEQAIALLRAAQTSGVFLLTHEDRLIVAQAAFGSRTISMQRRRFLALALNGMGNVTLSATEFAAIGDWLMSSGVDRAPQWVSK